MKIREEEQELRVLAKKSKKHDKKLNQFLTEKDKKLKNIWREEVDKRPELILRDMTLARDEPKQDKDAKTEISNVDNIPVSDARLKAFGLK